MCVLKTRPYSTISLCFPGGVHIEIARAERKIDIIEIYLYIWILYRESEFFLTSYVHDIVYIN